MATTLKTKNSVTAASAPSSLAQGELAVNITDKKLWVGNAATTPVQLLGTGSSAAFGAVTVTSLTDSGLTTGRVTYATTSGLLTDSANMVFDGSTLTTLNSAYTGTLTGGTGVVNLGSGQFYKDASGNVGIGQTNPGQKLDVSASGDIQVRIGNSVTGAQFTYDIGRVASTGLMQFYGNQSGATGYIFSGINGERMRIDSSGNVSIGVTPAGTGGCLQLKSGITFPAIQSASSDANTLDDYEEGTWAPSWTGGITSLNATYTKIGRVVYVSAQITATGATSGDLSGLPFGSVIDGSDCGSVGYQSVNVSTWNVLKVSSTLFRFYAGGTQQQFLISGNNARFAFSYIAST